MRTFSFLGLSFSINNVTHDNVLACDKHQQPTQPPIRHSICNVEYKMSVFVYCFWKLSVVVWWNNRASLFGDFVLLIFCFFARWFCILIGLRHESRENNSNWYEGININGRVTTFKLEHSVSILFMRVWTRDAMQVLVFDMFNVR